MKYGVAGRKPSWQSPIVRYLVASVLGASALAVFSLIQKRLLGLPDIFVLKGFVIPIIFGGGTGLLLMWLYSHVLNATDHSRQNQEKLLDFLDNASDLIQSVDPQGKFTYVNAAWRKTLKYAPEDLENLTVFDIIRPDKRDHCQSIFRKILNGEHVSHVETVFLAKDGTDVYVTGNLNFRMENGAPISTRGIFRDITAQHKALEKDRLAANVFESTQEAILVTDSRGVILTTNTAFTITTGYSASEVAGKLVYEIINPDSTPSTETGGEPVIPAHPVDWQGEMIGRRKNGETFPMRVAISLIRDEAGQIVNYVGIFSDITDGKRIEKRLEHLATHDFLTDLPNRALFHQQLEELIRCAQLGGGMLAVLFLDLDGFKNINDRFGHDFGDQLMRSIPERLKRCVRTSDLVARMGGDEFAIILGGISDILHATQIAQKIIDGTKVPFEIMGRQVKVTISIGISTYPKSNDARALLTDADFAMYQAKQSGKNTFHVFE